MQKEFENKETTEQKKTTKSIIKKYEQEQFFLPMEYYSIQKEMSWLDNEEERVKLSKRKVMTNYDEENVLLDRNLNLSQTNVSASTVLQSCYDYIKNNINNYNKIGEYENGIIIAPTYILISNKFLSHKELLLGLINKPIKNIITQNAKNFSELEGSFYEFLIREEIEVELANNISIVPRVIIPFDEIKEINYDTKEVESSKRNLKKFIEYDSLFYCEQYFTSNCKYEVLQLKKKESFKQLYFKKRIIYALVIKRSFSINGLLKMFKRIFLSMKYLEDIMIKFKTDLIHFMLFYNFKKSLRENDILQFFFNYFMKPTTKNYDLLKQNLLQIIYSEKKNSPEMIGFTNYYRQELIKAEKKLNDFCKMNETHQYLSFFANKIKTFKLSFIFYKPIINFLHYVDINIKEKKEKKEKDTTLEVIKDEMEHKVDEMKQDHLKMKEEMEQDHLKIKEEMEQSKLKMKEEMEQDHLKIKEEMKQSKLKMKEEMEQDHLKMKEEMEQNKLKIIEMEQSKLKMKEEMEQNNLKIREMEQKHEEEKKMLFQMLKLLQNSLPPQSNEQKTELNQSIQSDHSNPFNNIQTVIANILSHNQQNPYSNNLPVTEIPNPSQISPNLITKEDEKKIESQIIPQDNNDHIPSQNISLNINQPLNTQLQPSEIVAISINDSNQIVSSITSTNIQNLTEEKKEESASNENENDDEDENENDEDEDNEDYEIYLKRIDDSNKFMKTYSYLLLKDYSYGKAVISLSQKTIDLYIISKNEERFIKELNIEHTKHPNDLLIQVILITHTVIGISKSHVFIWNASDSSLQGIISVPSDIISCDIKNDIIIIMMSNLCYKGSLKDLCQKKEIVKLNYVYTDITIIPIEKYYGICRKHNMAGIILNKFDNNERIIDHYQFTGIITGIAWHKNKDCIFFSDHIGNLFQLDGHNEIVKNNKCYNVDIKKLLIYIDIIIIIFDREIRYFPIDQEDKEKTEKYDENIEEACLGSSNELYILLRSDSIIKLELIV